MHRMDMWEFHPLDRERVIPIVAEKVPHPRDGHERPEPLPMSRVRDEDTKVEVRAFVARSSKCDVSEPDLLRWAVVYCW